MMISHSRAFKIGFVLFILFILPVYAGQTFIISPNSLSFLLQPSIPSDQTIIFENHGNDTIDYNLYISDSISNIISIDKDHLSINPNSIETMNVRAIAKEPLNLSTGYIFLKDNSANIFYRIGITIDYVNTTMIFPTPISEVTYKALNIGLADTFKTVGDYLFSYIWIPKVSGIYDFLFLRITLFLLIFILLSIGTWWTNKIRSLGAKILVYAFVLPILSLFIVMIFPPL